jgi:hypothetical protein
MVETTNKFTGIEASAVVNFGKVNLSTDAGFRQEKNQNMRPLLSLKIRGFLLLLLLK